MDTIRQIAMWVGIIAAVVLIVSLTVRFLLRTGTEISGGLARLDDDTLIAVAAILTTLGFAGWAIIPLLEFLSGPIPNIAPQ